MGTALRGMARQRWIGASLPLLTALLLAACGASSTPASVTVTTGVAHSAPTATSAPIATATSATPPPHAFAWSQYDASHVPQIWASLNGATPVQITHVASAGGVCDTQIAWSPPVFSPDLTHIVAALGSFNCGDGVLAGPISVITLATGAVVNVPGSNTTVRINQRTSGWLDNNAIFFTDGQNLYTYVLGAATATSVPGVSNADEAVLRGTTLLYLRLDFSASSWTETVHRYDMSAHAALPGVITLGQVHACACSPGDFHTAGWDATANGAHVVYQAVTPNPGPDFGISGSQIMVANADGSSPTHIAQTLAASTLVRLQVSPNGQLVAITDAQPATTVVTASLSSPGLSGDPDYHTYTPAAVAFPVWKWDSSSFWAATDEDTGISGTGSLYYYQVGVPAAVVGVSGGYNPWYTLNH